MKTDGLLAHYEQVADAPSAVPRLRRFIFDLAMHGKLAPQDPTDEPASELLKQIAEERIALIARGEIRRGKPLAPIEVAPFNAPEGWVWLPLGEIGNIFIGNSINAATRERLTNTKAGRPFIATKDVGYGFEMIDYDNGLLVPTSDHGFKIARAGSVIICAEGGSAGRKIGLTDRDINFGNKLLANETFSAVAPKFVFYAYLSSYFYEQFTAKMTGIIGGISINKFLMLPFPLPPLAEQRRIVTKVGELMALCDRLEATRAEREATRDRLTAASLARLNEPHSDPAAFLNHTRFALDNLTPLTTRPDQIKQLRQTILNLAIRGKLVPQDPNDEPAAKQLSRIFEAKLAAAKVRSRKLHSNRNQVDYENSVMPIGWAAVRLADVAVTMRYGTSIKCDYDESGVPVLRIPNVSSGKISIDDLKFGPLKDTDQKELALEAGDLLMIRSNGSLDIVGRSAVVTVEAAGMSFAGYLVRLRSAQSEIDTRYIWLALNSRQVREQIEKPIRSAVGLKNVNLTEFSNLQFWLPPFAEQHRIVAKVDELMTLCDRLEASLATGDDTRRSLLDALLHATRNPETQELEAAE